MHDSRIEQIDLRVDGRELLSHWYDALSDLRVEQSIQVPGTFTLRFEDADFALIDSKTFDFGSSVTMAVGYDRPHHLMTGEVTSIGVDPNADGIHELVVTGFAEGHRLGRGVRVETYVNQKISGVVSAIAGQHKLSTSGVKSTPGVEEHLIQSESDYAFLHRLARMAGFVWWVTDGVLHFQAPDKGTRGPDLRWGEELTRFKARFSSAESSRNVEVRGWDADGARAVVGTSRGTGSLESGATAALATRLASKGPHHNRDRFNGSVGVLDLDEARAVADGIARRARSTLAQARGEATGDPQIYAGANVKLSGLGNELTGQYLVTSAQHIVGGGRRYTTRFQCGGEEGSAIPDILGGAARNGHTWPTTQVVVGIVSNLSDPDKLGRVKVKLPTLGDDVESHWARLVTAGAGKERGFQVRPEIDDEVLLAFEHGDIRRPFIIGGLWSKKSPPPNTSDLAANQVSSRVWKTRNGHRVELIDEDGQSGRMIIALGDERAELCLGTDKVALTAVPNIEIHTDGDLSIEAKGALKLTGKSVTIETKPAPGKVAVKAGTFEVDAKQKASIKAAQVEVNAQATMKLRASGIAEVKGALVKLN